MLPLWRIIPRAQNVFCKGLQTGAYPAKPVLELPVSIFGQTNNSVTKQQREMNKDIVCVEGIQGEPKEYSVSEARRVMSLASDYQCQGPSIQGTQAMQENYVTCLSQSSEVDHLSSQDAHSSVYDGLSSHVSLHGCMQTTVPSPGTGMAAVGYGSHLSMPGGGNKLLDKYLSSSNISCHQSRHLSTSSASNVSHQGAQESSFNEEYLPDPTPQGVQGDNCVRFKLWMENCQRYNLPNCDEQLESLKNGRKTLAEVFQEQQEIIRLVAEQYRRKNQQTHSDSNIQGQQDYFGYRYEFSLDEPCPQGLQGDDCANYKVWAHNCGAFGFGDCQQKMNDISTGRRSLQDVFDEQDKLIRQIVSSYQQRRQYSTSSKPEVGKNESNDSKTNTLHSSPQSDSNGELSQKDKLKRAVKEYGSTVVVFHVGISLISLGGFYLAVSSGIDVVGLLTKLGVGETILQSKIATGSTTFVVAYAVHKVFAPVRIAITLSCVPLVVRYLRKIGFLKPPKKTKKPQ